MLRSQVQQCIPMHINIVKTTSRLKIEIYESVLVIGYYTVHERSHETVVTDIDCFLLFEFFGEVDCDLQIARHGCDMQGCLAAIVRHTGICVIFFNKGTSRLYLAVKSGAM